jgi:hypothetical protein
VKRYMVEEALKHGHAYVYERFAWKGVYQEPKTNTLQLAITICSPWQWFCSTRTLSNCLETTLTIMALNYWPWQWSLEPQNKDSRIDEIRAEPETEELELEKPVQ